MIIHFIVPLKIDKYLNDPVLNPGLRIVNCSESYITSIRTGEMFSRKIKVENVLRTNKIRWPLFRWSQMYNDCCCNPTKTIMTA